MVSVLASIAVDRGL